MHFPTGATTYGGWQNVSLLIGFFGVFIVTATPTKETRRHTVDSTSSNLNQTERFRRLIPYMRFYIPSTNNEQLPVNQAYSYAPTNGPKPLARPIQSPPPQQHQLHEYQQPPQLTDHQHQVQSPVRQVIRQPVPQNSGRPQPHHIQSTASGPAESSQFVYDPQQQQQQHAHIVPSGHSGIVYKEHHRAGQPNRAYAEGALHIPHQRTKVEHQPRTNYNRHNQYLPSTSHTLYEKQKTLTPFLAINQVPGDFRPLVIEEHQPQQLEQRQPQTVQPIQYERQQQNIEYQDPHQRPLVQVPQPENQPTHSLTQQSTSSPARFYYQTNSNEDIPDKTNFVTPINYVKYIKPTQTPQELPGHHQPESSALPLRQVQAAPISHQQQGPIRTYQVPYRSEDDRHNSQHSLNSLLNSRYYAAYDYGIELDPDDGYGAKVPMHSMRPPITSSGRYAGFSDNPTTSTPIIASPTPFHARPKTQPQQRPFEHQPYSYEHIANKPTFRPTLATPTVHQHLTETTHLHAPSEPPYTQDQEPDQSYLPNHPDHTTFVTARPNSKVSTDHPMRHFYETTSQEMSPQIPVQHPPPQRTPIPSSQYYERRPQFDTRNPDFQNILSKLQHSHLLPQKLSDATMDGSIKALIDILNHIKESQHISEIPSQYVAEVPPQHVEGAPVEQGPAYGGFPQSEVDEPQTQQPEQVVYQPVSRPQHKPVQQKPRIQQHPSVAAEAEDTDDYYEDTNSNENAASSGVEPGPNTGRPGIDYPALAEIPATSFNCKEQRYKGFFGDPETHCQVWHYCDLNGGQASFLCPNGTIFSQVALTCDWWFNVKCSTTTQLYVLNERLYKYILPFSPKFPEDYTGPVVDKYLAQKYAEMEEKMRREKLKGKESESEDESSEKIVENTSTSSESSERHLAETEATPMVDANGAQIDDEGQSHNVDNAIQYIDESDTIDPPKPTSTPIPEYSDNVIVKQRIEFVSSTTENGLVSEQPGEQREQRSRHPPEPQQIIVAEEDDTEVEQEVEAAADDSTSHETPKQILEYDQPKNPASRPNTVKVETERLHMIEIKSDGSTGHLIPAQYQ